MPDKQHRRRSRASLFVPVSLLLASMIMLSISTDTLEPASNNAALVVASGAQRVFSSIGNGVSEVFNSFGEARRLRQENKELTERLERFASLERSAAELRQENERLREQLGIAPRAGFKRVAARIIAKDPEARFFTITIDKGTIDGLAKNMPVIGYQNGIEGIVGKIVVAGARNSMIIPLNDSRFFVAARISTTRNEGLVTGGGSEYSPLILKYIPKTVTNGIQFGDLVVTSGYESVFPPDIAIGRVRKIDMPDYLPSAEIKLDRVLDFSRLEFVYVLVPSNETPTPVSDALQSGFPGAGSTTTISQPGIGVRR